MKGLLISIVAIVGLLFLSDFIYKTFKRQQRVTVLTDDRAVIYAYNQLAPEDIRTYFSLPDSTFERIKDNFEVTCDVEDHAHLHLINNRSESDIATIDCTLGFDFNRQLEISKEYEANGYQLRVKLTSPPSGSVIASKYIHVAWDHGKVNHLIIAKDKAYKYCSN